MKPTPQLAPASTHTRQRTADNLEHTVKAIKEDLIALESLMETIHDRLDVAASLVSITLRDLQRGYSFDHPPVT